MKTLLAILTVCLFSSLSHAQVTADGSWNGWLYWSYDSTPIRCTTMMQYKQTSTVFERLSGKLDCEYVAMDMGTRQWTLSRGAMLEGNKVVGSYEGNNFKWTEIYSETVTISSELKVEARHMDYREKWVRNSDGLVIYSIEGRLFKRDQSPRRSNVRRRIIRRAY
jgi:hypothetical protein